MGPNKLSRHSFKQHGFSLAEVLLALFFVTMAIALVGGLGQQVMNFAKRASQTGAVIEIRSMMNAISKNSDSWLSQMRSSIETQGVYAGCIPDPTVNITTFSCPQLEKNLNDSELNKIAGSVFHVASSPILDASGEKIAGTIEQPVYLDSQGRICESENKTTCALMSTGYFMRSNPDSNEDPGNIKFVIKIQNNPTHIPAGTPMRPQYMSLDIGQDWKDQSVVFGGNCPSGTIKIGYLSNGNPSCVSTISSCPDNKLPIGVDSSGKPVCQSLPDCSTSGGSVVLDSSGQNLVCANASPCGENKLFLGYFAGTGEPMCSGSSVKCDPGQLQVGISIAEGVMKAECETPPSCTDANKMLTFDGTKFVCDNRSPASVVRQCAAPNEYIWKINYDGSVECRTLEATAAASPAGKIVVVDKMLKYGSPSTNTINSTDGNWVSMELSSTIPASAESVLVAVNCECSHVFVGNEDASSVGKVSSNTNSNFSKYKICASDEGQSTGSKWVVLTQSKRNIAVSVRKSTSCSPESGNKMTEFFTNAYQ